LEVYRKTAFNANNFFTHPTFLDNGQNVPREPLIRNQFGGRFSGPIVKDRTFFFVSYEGKRESRGFSRNRLVYTQPARQGIYRYIKGLPTTPANAAAATVTAAAGLGTTTTQNGTCSATVTNIRPTGTLCTQNVLAINTNRVTIDPAVSAYIGKTPLPNNFQIGDGLNTGGFRFNAKVISPTDQVSLRLDHRFSDKHSLEASYNYGDINFNGDYINSGEEAFPGAPYRTRNTIGRGITGAFRSVVSPTIINEARFGAQISTLTFANTADVSRGYQFDLATIFNPENSFLGSNRNLRVLQWTDNVTILRGSHSFKTGIELRNLWVRRYAFAGTLPVIEFGTTNDPLFSQAQQFGGSQTADYTAARVLANTIAGAVATVTQVFNVVNPKDGVVVRGAPEVRQYANWETNLYLQDSWRFRQNLTLNLGVRDDLNRAPKEGNDPRCLWDGDHDGPKRGGITWGCGRWGGLPAFMGVPETAICLCPAR